jgi:predicted nucleic-acid-binding protein
MIVNLDTNVLVRLLKQDDDRAQTQAALASVRDAEAVVITVPVLCEAAWVLAGAYRFSRAQIGDAFEQLLATERVRTDSVVAERGIAMLRAGGDFADGVIAELGAIAGAHTFLTLDRKAARRLDAMGLPVNEPRASR